MSRLISFERCQSSCEEHGTSEHNKKILSTVGFEPPTPHDLQISSPLLSPLGHQSLGVQRSNEIKHDILPREREREKKIILKAVK